MLNKINLEVIKSFSPCISCNPCLSNFIKYHKSFEGTPIEFLKLDNITFKDKYWVLIRTDFLSEKQIHEYGIFNAELVLPIFEENYPNDNRPRKAIQVKKDWLNGKVNDEELSRARSAASYAEAYVTAFGDTDVANAARVILYATSICAEAIMYTVKFKELEEQQLEELIRIFETL